MSNPDVLVIGGGLAGLCCARRLQGAGVTSQILEASDRVGGRARTDEVDGFLCDRGFQVLLTAYPEAREVLDFAALDLGRFEPGALIRHRGQFHRFVDPWRCPRHFLATAVSPVASLRDKLRVARLRRRVCRGSLQDLYERPETTTLDRLREEGFSSQIIERFFRPFLGGVFLDRELKTSSRMFEFVFRMFASGDAVLPARGMGALADQIAGQLPAGSIRTGARVDKIEKNGVRLASGQYLTASRIVVACEAPVAARLLGEKDTTAAQSVTCFYFAARQPPVEEPILVLNGDGAGPINNLCVPSQVTGGYAPQGQSLISVTVLGVVEPDQDLALRQRVVEQLQDWFGSIVKQWRPLKTCRIPFALPAQNPPALTPVAKSAERQDGLFVCGDYLDTASIQGAMVSGRRAADRVIAARQA